MRYALALIALIAAPVAAQHEHHHGKAHEVASTEQVAAMTSARIERMKAAELQYQGAAMAYESLPKLTAPHFEARAYDALEHFRTKINAPEDEFIAADFYFNFSIKELLDYVREQKASK